MFVSYLLFGDSLIRTHTHWQTPTVGQSNLPVSTVLLRLRMINGAIKLIELFTN